MNGSEDIINRKVFILDTLLKNDKHISTSRYFLDDASRYPASFRALKELQEEGFIHDYSNSPIVKLTYEGLDIAKVGYTEHLKNLEKEFEQEKQDVLLERQKAQLEVKQLSFLDKTRWWPHVISIVSLIVAVIALIQSFKK